MNPITQNKGHVQTKVLNNNPQPTKFKKEQLLKLAENALKKPEHDSQRTLLIPKKKIKSNEKHISILPWTVFVSIFSYCDTNFLLEQRRTCVFFNVMINRTFNLRAIEYGSTIKTRGMYYFKQVFNTIKHLDNAIDYIIYLPQSTENNLQQNTDNNCKKPPRRKIDIDSTIIEFSKIPLSIVRSMFCDIRCYSKNSKMFHQFMMKIYPQKYSESCINVIRWRFKALNSSKTALKFLSQIRVENHYY